VSARFAPGDAVRVRAAHPPGHIRTPVYARGRAGVVERVVGDFPNPEELAYGRDGLPERTLYRVRFTQQELWGEGGDTVEIELYDHWLEAP
jgi:hypothetical protein